jgi:linoleoyl-CoA desaturase
LANFLGAFHTTWKIQHNVLHHSYTNVDGFDEDIDTPVMRFSPDQEHKKYHRFQAFYAPFLYGIMTIHWFLNKDFRQIIRYKNKELLAKEGVTFRQSMINAAFHKAWYLGLTLFLPMWGTGLPWWQVLLGFLLMHFISGLLLSLIFQTAHVINETEFYAPTEDGSVENNWAIHQMRTTANFANGSKLFSWYIGGLNYQIEHHLFPNICHVHYRKISKIVRDTAKEFDVPYHHHKTFFEAVRSHFSLLYQLGTGKEKKKLIEA